MGFVVIPFPDFKSFILLVEGSIYLPKNNGNPSKFTGPIGW